MIALKDKLLQEKLIKLHPRFLDLLNYEYKDSLQEETILYIYLEISGIKIRFSIPKKETEEITNETR